MSEPQQKKRTKNRGNTAQMTLLREFMAANVAFANNQIDHTVYWATWESLTKKLNAKGTIRSAKAWEKTWADQLRKNKPTVEDPDIPETVTSRRSINSSITPPRDNSQYSQYKICSMPPREKSTRSPPKLLRSPQHDRSRQTLQRDTSTRSPYHIPRTPKREESKRSPTYQIPKTPQRDRSSRSPDRYERPRTPKRDRSSRSPDRYERPRTPQRDRSSRSPYQHKRPRTPQRDRSSRSPYQYKRPRTPQDGLPRSTYRTTRSPQRDRLSRSPCRISSLANSTPITPPRNVSRAATFNRPESSAMVAAGCSKDTDNQLTSVGQTLTKKTTAGNHHREDGIIDLTDDEVRLDAKQHTRTAKPLGPNSHAVIQFMKDNSKDNERIVADIMNILKTQNEILRRGLASITQAITDWKPNKNNAAVESDAGITEGRNLCCKDEERKEEECKEETEYELDSDQYEAEYLDDDVLRYLTTLKQNH